MKKFWLTAVSLLLVFALTACNGEDSVETKGTTAGGDTTTTSVQTEQPPETTVTSEAVTTPTSSPDTPQLGSGIFEGMTPSAIWNLVMGNLSNSTGLDANVTSKSVYAIGAESQQEEQNVHIQLNVGEDSYSYAVETDTNRTLSDVTYTEWSYLAFKDGWFYQSSRTDESGSPVQSSAKIAMTEEALTEQGLDLETILAINAMVNMGMFNFDGQELGLIFREVNYVELEGGRSQIVCKGMQADKLVEILLGSLGDLGTDEGDVDLESLGTLFAGIAQLMSCDVTLTISATGMLESLNAAVSLEMTDPMSFAVSTEYTLTVNAAGANAGKVTLPEGSDQYPEYESFEDYLKAVAGI